VLRTFDQLRRFVRHGAGALDLDEAAEGELAMALLVAFPDRVAKRRTPEGADLVLRSGATARLAETTVVTKAQWFLAIDAEERREPGRAPISIVRIASAIKEDWLLDVLGDCLTDEEELCWLDPPGRVESRSRIRLGSLVVEESRRPAKPGPAAAAVLLGVLEQTGLLNCDELARLFERLALHGRFQKSDGGAVDWSAWKASALSDLLQSRIDLQGLDTASLAASLQSCLPPSVAEALRLLVPEFIVLPKGRRCLVHYDPGRPAWIESRLQDFFGLTETPTILSGRQKLVIHLLAPNQRAVQITDDLRGFWSNHYPEIRRQLQRRYPKHAWPEDGQAASPPDPRPARHRG
jgi:ATP-dependent helicase HrpB